MQLRKVEQMTATLDGLQLRNYVKGLYAKAEQARKRCASERFETCVFEWGSTYAENLGVRQIKCPKSTCQTTAQSQCTHIGLLIPNAPERTAAARQIVEDAFSSVLAKASTERQKTVCIDTVSGQLRVNSAGAAYLDQPLASTSLALHRTTICPFILDGISYTVGDITTKLFHKLQRSLRSPSTPTTVILLDHAEDAAFISRQDTKCIAAAFADVAERLAFRCERSILLVVCSIAENFAAIQRLFPSSVPFDLSKCVPFKKIQMVQAASEHELVKSGAIRPYTGAPAPVSEVMERQAYRDAKRFCALRIRKMLSMHERSKAGASDLTPPIDSLCELRTGILLHGSPGCGKTTLLHDLMHELSPLCPFYRIVAPLLLSPFVGETERNVRALFAFLQANAPCVYTIEALDTVAAARGDQQANILCALLCELDGISAGGA